MCVGAGNKSSRDPCLPQCRNEAVTRKQGRISARCGLISQGSWPGIERLCHSCTAAAVTAGFWKKKKIHKKQTNETKQEDLPTLPGTHLWRRVLKWPSLAPPQRPKHFSATSLDNVLHPFHTDLWGEDDKTATGKKPARQNC